MTMLWMVLQEIDREPGSVIGVFSTRERADEVSARLKASDKWCGYPVLQIGLDQEYEPGDIR